MECREGKVGFVREGSGRDEWMEWTGYDEEKGEDGKERDMLDRNGKSKVGWLIGRRNARKEVRLDEGSDEGGQEEGHEVGKEKCCGKTLRADE